jgi:hypothetical protein
LSRHRSKATGYWFPRQERSLATSIFDAAAKFSNVVGIPLVALVVVRFGWWWGFGMTGLLSFLYFLAFLIVYRDPSKHPRLGLAEREYIRAGGATPEGPAPSGGFSGAITRVYRLRPPGDHRGIPDQAMRAAASGVAEARAIKNAMSLGLALAVAACPVSLWVGDLAAAEHYIEMLLDDSTTHALARWRVFGLGLSGSRRTPRSPEWSRTVNAPDLVKRYGWATTHTLRDT